MMGQLIRSNQTRGARVVKTINITQDNQLETVDLPRGPHIEYVMVRVTGTINITTTYTAVRSSAAYLYLSRADWTLNSNVTLDSVSGGQIAQSYVTRRNVPPAVNPAGFGVGAQSFSATFVLDRALMDMKRPKDSMLKTDIGVSNNQLRLSFGKLSDMFTGAGVAAYTAVTATIIVGDYQEAHDSKGNTPQPAYYIKRNGQRIALPASGSNQLIKLNTGNRLRLVSMRVLDGVTFEPSVALLTRLRVVRAGDTRVDITVPELQALNTGQYGYSLIGGQIVYDFANAGQLSGVMYSEFWPIPSSADTFLSVDTTASSVLEILTLEGVDFEPASA